ncbi:MAG: hypothetical protein IPL39_19215 [Opitutaceae bacterium]|nr:hypothetical protein [Opitutaceae bacterium]
MIPPESHAGSIASASARSPTDPSVASPAENNAARILRASSPRSPSSYCSTNPPATLDFPAQESLVRLLHELWHESGTTIVLVTHDLRHLPPGPLACRAPTRGPRRPPGHAEETLTAEALSETFGQPVKVYRHRGRWTATAEVRDESSLS